MPGTFSEIQERLANASLRDIVNLAAAGVNGRTFNEIAALRERFLDIAFREDNSTFDDRMLAAAWSRALDSGLMLMLENMPETLAAYVRARSTSMEEVFNHGFGSIGHAARTNRELLLNRLSLENSEDAEVNQVRLLRAHLAAAAFGIEVPAQDGAA